MPIYYFHITEAAGTILDLEGRDIDGHDLVVAAAITEARAILSADALTGIVDLESRIDVEDEDGRIVHRQRLADAVQFR